MLPYIKIKDKQYSLSFKEKDAPPQPVDIGVSFKTINDGIIFFKTIDETVEENKNITSVDCLRIMIKIIRYFRWSLTSWGDVKIEYKDDEKYNLTKDKKLFVLDTTTKDGKIYGKVKHGDKVISRFVTITEKKIGGNGTPFYTKYFSVEVVEYDQDLPYVFILMELFFRGHASGFDGIKTIKTKEIYTPDIIKNFENHEGIGELFCEKKKYTDGKKLFADEIKNENFDCYDYDGKFCVHDIKKFNQILGENKLSEKIKTYQDNKFNGIKNDDDVDNLCVELALKGIDIRLIKEFNKAAKNEDPLTDMNILHPIIEKYTENELTQFYRYSGNYYTGCKNKKISNQVYKENKREKSLIENNALSYEINY